MCEAGVLKLSLNKVGEGWEERQRIFPAANHKHLQSIGNIILSTDV